MTNEDILRRVDHTLLKAASSWKEIEKLCEEAIKYKTASVCIPPSYVESVFRSFKGITVCTVIGFPLGYSLTAAKVHEAECALLAGATELDMVINIGDVKNNAFGKVEEEITLLKKTAGNKILKVIVETCYLSREEKIRLCEIVSKAGADFIKTSTGFGSSGATIDDIVLFKEHIGPGVKIKAAGGIKTRDNMVSYLENGCSRLGTSSAVALLSGAENKVSGY